jgi:nucleotide-binding universal stress UspA family protein
MIKDILLTITRTDADDLAVKTAVQIAEIEKAHLAIMIPVEYPVPIPSEFGVNPYPMYVGIYEESLKVAENMANELKEKWVNADISPIEVRVVSTPLMNSLQLCALHARHADLSVIGGNSTHKHRNVAETIFSELLMDSGRPILFVPAGSDPVIPAKRVLIAWQPTRESTRAVHDAMPFLHKSASIDILMVNPEVSDSGHGQQPGADIATHLARHGLNVRVVAQPSMGRNKGQAILEYAKQTDAQLIVAGGYSHSRFREQIMGGVTRELVRNMTIPVLFSH